MGRFLFCLELIPQLAKLSKMCRSESGSGLLWDRLLVCLVVPLLAAGCPLDYVIILLLFPAHVAYEDYALVEITRVGTGEPVAGAELSAAVLSADEDLPDAVLSFYGIAPTDALGRTPVLYYTFETDLDRLVLALRIRSGADKELLRVADAVGATATGSEFAARVMAARGARPEPPILAVVSGSDPAVIEIGGYVDAVGVCSCESGTVVWEVGRNIGEYVDHVSVGSVPDGWQDFTWTTGNLGRPERRDCGVVGADCAPGEYLIYASAALESGVIRGPCYALGPDGSVVIYEPSP